MNDIYLMPDPKTTPPEIGGENPPTDDEDGGT